MKESYEDREYRNTKRIEVSLGGPVMPLNIPAGQWHAMCSLEVKDGPYEPLGPEDILTL